MHGEMELKNANSVVWKWNYFWQFKRDASHRKKKLTLHPSQGAVEFPGKLHSYIFIINNL